VPETVVLLHGFSGTRRSWDAVAGQLDRERYLPLALDLPGHGAATGEDRPITFSSCVAEVLARSPERFVLCGYSLGGRVALHVALAAPARVTRLVLVSTTAGIADPRERAARRAADRRLARELEEISIEEFIERWREQPLFAEDPVEVGERAAADQRLGRPGRLAAALRGIGTGEMEPLWERLRELTMPVTVTAGERDVKFLALARRMTALLPAGELAVVPGGHRLPFESPAALAGVLEGSDRLDAEPGGGR